MLGNGGFSAPIMEEIKRLATGIAHELWADLHQGAIEQIGIDEIRSMIKLIVVAPTNPEVMELLEAYTSRCIVEKTS